MHDFIVQSSAVQPFLPRGRTRKLSEAVGRNSKLKGGRTECLGNMSWSKWYARSIFNLHVTGEINLNQKMMVG